MFDAISTLLAAIAAQKAGRLPEAEALVQAVLAHDPDEPSALFLLGSIALGAGRAAAAVAPLRQAVALRPGHRPQRLALARALLLTGQAEAVLQVLEPFAEARLMADVQFLRGTALSALHRPHEAAAALMDAASADPAHADTQLNLGNALTELDRTEAAEAHMRAAIALQPNLAEAHASLGFLLTGRGALQEAVACCERAIELAPDFAAAHWNQGIAYLLGGQMEAGWAQYEWRKRHFPEAFSAPPGPQWDGAPLQGRTLLVLAEQGFGDTIQLSRYLPPLVAAGSQVVLECAPRLTTLLRRLPGVTLLPPGYARPATDVWADQMSLPRLAGTTLATIPAPCAQLRPSPAEVAARRAGRPDQQRIGLVWAGNPAHSNDRRRSIPVSALAPLMVAGAGRFVSLQLGPAASAAVALYGLAEPSPGLTDFADTAALIAGLDLVITVDTAVAHLAGTLGIPTWVMLPHAPDWRWMLGRDDSPWYPSMRLFRQARPGDWAGVLTRVAAALPAPPAPPLAQRYSIAIPPLTCSVAPVTQPASADAR